MNIIRAMIPTKKRGEAIGFDGYNNKETIRYVECNRHTVQKKSAYDGNGQLRAKYGYITHENHKTGIP